MSIFTDYINHIKTELETGQATEHTYRTFLKILIEGLDSGIVAINEPKHIECGAPDFIIMHGEVPVGHIEAKDIGQPLNQHENSDQLKSYREALPNLILTDYLEFRWYTEGEIRSIARIATKRSGSIIKMNKAEMTKLETLFDGFLAYKSNLIGTPQELAVRLARLAHLIRDAIIEAFTKKEASELLTDLRHTFTQVLIPDLELPEKTPDFADMYAQTITYGLFAARCNHSGPIENFTRANAAGEIPNTNPFLRKLFNTITGPELRDEPYVGYVDTLVDLLLRIDLSSVLEQFVKHSAGEDPVIHFYETFLTAYDPKLRELRGVYYTPEPVVSYIVRSVDYLLKTHFNCPEGLAETSTVEYEIGLEKGKKQRKTAHKVLILDPACGTGTFLYSTIDLIRNSFMQEGNAGIWSGYIRKHLLPRLFGFELLMAPYAVAHLKLGMQLAGLDLPDALREKWNYDFASSERLGIYLTNTLEKAEEQIETIFGPWRIISDEARAAAEIKRDLPIMVILGNPPYSGHSANASQRMTQGTIRTTFIGQLIQDYYKVDGDPLMERNSKWLQNDYVKFIRWGQWRIKQAGGGILAFITDNSYLDNPTFRGLRQNLMNDFDEIYILDLHGNTRKKEVAPDGLKDENVFDIQQGVAICLMVKKHDGRPSKDYGRIFHSELWGTRKKKYELLKEMTDLGRTAGYQELTPGKPYYLFVPKDWNLKEEYEKWPKISDCFTVNSVGIVTARDRLTVHFTKEELFKVVSEFARLPEETARDRFNLGKDVRDWKVSFAQKDILESGLDKELIHLILYRPFDHRFTYYTGRTRGFICMPRPEVMRHLLGQKNLALISTRQMREYWDCFVAGHLIGHKSCSAYDINYVYPLYLYPDPGDLIENHIPNGSPHNRRPNLTQNIIMEINSKLAMTFTQDGKGDLEKTWGPEDIFHYIYAVFHSPTYRERYAEFLKIDFPRLPLTSDKELFRALCTLGERLIELHLLENTSQVFTKFPEKGNNKVEKVRYQDIESGRVWINKIQYFKGIPPEVWEFRIGGYQVCQKWLKDRTGRELGYEELTAYPKIVSALSETMKLMQEIDETIPGWPIE